MDLFNITSATSLVDLIIGSNDNEELDCCVTILKTICCGPPDDKFSNIYNKLLPPTDCLAAVLKAGKVDENIAEDLLSLTCMNEELWTCFFNIAVTNNSKKILNKMFNHPNVKNIPVNIVEEALKIEPYIFEQVVLNSTNFELWTDWSCKSSNIYQITTSILNEFFILQSSQKMSETIYNYVNETRKKCGSDDNFIQLYPSSVRHLVLLMTLKTENTFYIKYVVNKFNELVLFKCEQALALLLHFKTWQDYL